MAAATEAHESETPEIAQRGWRARWSGAAAGCRQWLRRRRADRPSDSSPASGTDALRELWPLLDRLGKESKPLSALAAEMERAFLSIADSLVELPGASDKLVQHSHRLVAMSTGRENGDSIYQATYASLSGPLQFVDSHWETTRQLRGQLEESMAAIDGMLRHEDDLARTVAPLKYIQTLFKVESAGLDTSVQGMFLALTEEISALQRRVSDTFGEKFLVLRDLRRILANVVLDLEQRDTQLRHFLSERRASLDQALTDLRTDLEQNRQRDAKLTQVSKGVAEQVGRLVLGLQAQDIVSQKIAHVIEGIGQVLNRSSSSDAMSDRVLEAALLRFIVQSASVEHAQLESIRGDLRQTEEQLKSAISAIEDQAGQLDHECLSMRDFDRLTVGYPGLIETLLEAVDDVSELVKTTASSTDQAFAEIQPLGGRTSNVTATMRELSAHIRVIALNAQVQAARLDNRTGLEVLAAATNRVATETGGISEEIATRLDQFATGMDGLVKEFTCLHDRGAQELQSWHEQSGAERQSLHNVRDLTLAEMNLTGECADRIRELARQMRDKINVSAQIDPGLRIPAVSLNSLVQLAKELLLQPRYAGLPAELPPEFNQGSGRKYTMESERKVYEAALAATSTAVPVGAPLESVTVDSELSAVPAAASGESPGEGIGHLTGLASSGAPNQSTPEKKEFGDNVDLF